MLQLSTIFDVHAGAHRHSTGNEVRIRVGAKLDYNVRDALVFIENVDFGLQLSECRRRDEGRLCDLHTPLRRSMRYSTHFIPLQVAFFGDAIDFQSKLQHRLANPFVSGAK